MAFTFTTLPDWVRNQFLTYTILNRLKDNQENIKDSLEVEHTFSSGEHVHDKSCRYTTNTNQNVATSTDVIIDFEDKDFEYTVDRVTIGAAWKYTATRATRLRVSATIAMGDDVGSSGWAIGDSIVLKLRKNGVVQSNLGRHVFETAYSGALAITVTGTDIVDVAIADYVDVVAWQNSGNTTIMLGSTTGNHIGIEEIGV